MIARSPRPGSGREERVLLGRPRPAGSGSAEYPRRGRILLRVRAGAPRGSRAGSAPGSARTARAAPASAAPPSLSTRRRARGAGSAAAAPARLGCPAPALLSLLPLPRRSQARRGQPEQPPNGGSRGAARGERGPGGASGPPCPSPGAVAANSRDSVFGGGNKSHPTHSPDRNVCHCLPITRG